MSGTLHHSCGQLRFVMYITHYTSLHYDQVKVFTCSWVSSVPTLRGVCSEVCIRTLPSCDCTFGLFYTAEHCLVVFAISHKENNSQS